MKFNFNVKSRTATVNHQGAAAFRMTQELELYTAVTTTMLSDVSYEKEDQRLTRIKTLVQQVDPAFVAKLAIYARQQMNLRTAPIVLATELAGAHQGDDLVRKTIVQVVQRPDEIMEILAYYQVTNKRTGTKKLNKISKQVQKGLAASFNNFDEYQFAKYNRDTAVKLRDALFLVHPKAKDDQQQDLFHKIAHNNLATPYTWETELSAVGTASYLDDADKKRAMRQKWEELVDSKRMGYMATLRNLRNMLEAGISSTHIEQVCSYLSHEKAVFGSRQLPFRFLAAYRELRSVAGNYTGQVMEALEKALHLSVANMKSASPDTRIVIACDVSGSMQRPVSPRSKVQLYDIALLLGMTLQSRCRQVVSGMFGNSWKTIALPVGNILANVDAFHSRAGEVGLATNGYLVLKDLADRKHVADKIMLFTDLQLWDSNTNNMATDNTIAYQWAAYKKIAPNARLYLFDLSGYGQVPLRTPQKDVYLIAGWSDKIFDVMDAMENGDSAITMIRAMEL